MNGPLLQRSRLATERHGLAPARAFDMERGELAELHVPERRLDVVRNDALVAVVGFRADAAFARLQPAICGLRNRRFIGSRVVPAFNSR